jgi:SAM-dependent methyltransferase
MRGRPRLWHHDYLHLRPLGEDVRARLSHWGRPGGPLRILDLGSGSSPYREWVGPEATRYVRCDVDPASRPDVVGRAERLPFAEGTFDAVIATQVLDLVESPRDMAREIARVLVPGGEACVTTPLAYPYDSAAPGNRFGERQLRELFEGLDVVEIRTQGGMMTAPFLLANVGVREAVLAARRRAGVVGAVLAPFAAAFFVVANLGGRLLERLASSGPLAPFLGYLDRRMPLNVLVLAVKRR